MSDLENERGNKAITTGTSGAMMMKVLLFFILYFTEAIYPVVVVDNKNESKPQLNFFFYCMKNREFCCP